MKRSMSGGFAKEAIIFLLFLILTGWFAVEGFKSKVNEAVSPATTSAQASSAKSNVERQGNGKLVHTLIGIALLAGMAASLLPAVFGSSSQPSQPIALTVRAKLNCYRNLSFIGAAGVAYSVIAVFTGAKDQGLVLFVASAGSIGLALIESNRLKSFLAIAASAKRSGAA